MQKSRWGSFMSKEINWRFSEKDIDRVREVLKSNFSASHPTHMCQELEEIFAKKVSAKYGIAFNSGTNTLHGCIGVAGIGPGDEVIVPALNVLHTAAAVLYQNAVPVFADSEEDTFNVSPESIEDRITPQTKAIIAVSLYGLPVDFDRILKIAKERDLVVIEDDAEAHGAVYKGKMLGSIGDMASFSFEASKVIAVGDGGIVTTNSKEYADKLRAFAFLGYKVMSSDVGDARNVKDIFQDPRYSRHGTFGFSYKLPEVVCAIGISQVKRYEYFVNLRCQIAKMYDEVLEDCEWMVPQFVPKDRKNTYWTYAVKYEGKDWRRFRKEYMKNGGDGIYAAWTPTYLETVFQKGEFYGRGCPTRCPLYKGKVNYKKGLCPTTEKIQPKIMQFCTNYGSVEEATPKIKALEKTIKQHI
jgi:perosamine synthetase